ncbi:hypothetical protein [Alteromonas sp. M12]|uniref:hypothetical protein n=1 Tax=Alteromonas sp. M12 TaxID=3135644 RepID=UPI00319DDF24
MATQTLAALPDTYTIHSLPLHAQIPSQMFNASSYLSLVCIMTQIGNVLVTAKISRFVVSNFETDNFLIKQNDIDSAANARENHGYKVVF